MFFWWCSWQKRGFPPTNPRAAVPGATKKGLEAHSHVRRAAHVAQSVARDTRNTAVQCSGIEKDALKEGARTLDHPRLPTKSRTCSSNGSSGVVVPVAPYKKHACITQQQRERDPQLTDSHGFDKKNNYLVAGTVVSMNRKPQQCSADKLPHTREVASCPAGGRQACTAL